MFGIFQRLLAPVIFVLSVLLLSACAGAPMQPLAFNAPPWADGEISLYDVLDRNGAALGTAYWRMEQTPEGWSQSYALNISGRPDEGDVLLGDDLRPIRSWRENAAGRIETEYGPGQATIGTTPAAGGDPQIKTLPLQPDTLDNDQVLQAQRALPLAEGYGTSYVNLVPITASAIDSTFRVVGTETLTVPAGTFATWRAEMKAGGGTHDVWYGQAPPYPMVQYRNRSSGSVFQLRQIGTDVDVDALPRRHSPPVRSSRRSAMPLLLSTALIQLPLMLIFPLALGWWIKRRYGPGWGIFAAGALTFVLAQVVHLPLNYALGLLGGGRGVALWPLIPMALVAGLSAALCEEGARWIVLTFFLKRVRTWAPGLQYGAGHGGGEAIIFGLLVLINLVTMLALPSMGQLSAVIPPETMDQIRSGAAVYWATPWYMAILGGLERVFAITLQIAMALLVVRSVAERKIIYLLAAIGIHTAIDAFAVWSMQTLGIFPTELGVAVMGLGGLWLIIRLRAPMTPPMTPPAAPAPIVSDPPVQPATARPPSNEELTARASKSQSMSDRPS